MIKGIDSLFRDLPIVIDRVRVPNVTIGHRSTMSKGYPVLELQILLRDNANAPIRSFCSTQ
jgi:hypothetical protein